jgi:hypothetical protein
VVADEFRSAGGAAETAEVDARDERAVGEHGDAVAAGAGSIDVSCLGHDRLDRRAALGDERGRRGNGGPPRKVGLERVVVQPRAPRDAAAVAQDYRVAGAPRARGPRWACGARRGARRARRGLDAIEIGAEVGSRTSAITRRRRSLRAFGVAPDRVGG